MSHLLTAMHLSVRVGEVLGLGLVAGWNATLLLLPRRFAVRWIVFAPIAAANALLRVFQPVPNASHS